MHRTLFAERLVALFFLGCLLFGYPLLAVFTGGTVFGIPRLYVYLFAAWALLVVLLALICERAR